MDNGDPYDPPENPPILYPPSLIPSQQRESDVPTSWPRQDGAAGTGMVSLLEEDGTSVGYNLNTFRYSSPAIDVAQRQYSMVHADLENCQEATSAICVNGTHAFVLEPHPYCNRESPPTQTIQPLEYRESPLQEQNAYLAKSSILSANISSPPKQETCPHGLEELAVSNTAHDKNKRVFKNREQDVVPEEPRLTATERIGHAMTVGRNTRGNDCLNTFEGRLSTFRNWPKESVVPANKLAEDGFVFAGCPDRPDLVMCAKCKNTLHGWQEGDNPRNEHFKHFKKNCF